MTNKNEKKTKSIVIGRPGTAEEFCDYLREVGVENVEFLDCTKLMLLGHSVSYCGNGLHSLRLNKPDIRAAYCPIRDNRDRILFLKWARGVGYETPNFIHPNTEIDPTVKLEPDAGIYVFKGAKIGQNVEIGKASIVTWDVCIAKGAKIGKGVFISPGARLGKCCTILDKAHVENNVPDGVTVAGDPAKPL